MKQRPQGKWLHGAEMAAMIHRCKKGRNKKRLHEACSFQNCLRIQIENGCGLKSL
jgi:hypothetical protein